jgi:uncharacterized protein YjbI with pentapeptide repeats
MTFLSPIAIPRCFLAALLCCAVVVPAEAQLRTSVSLSTTNQNGIVISWTAQSATPASALIIVPQYQVHRSRDLHNWARVGGLFSGALGQLLSLTDTNANVGFYRVQSIINKEYAALSGVKLDGGQLDGADFFGATLFGASIKQSSLVGANLSGADLRSADISSSDLSGADLFGVQAFGTSFRLSTLTGSDCSFGDFETANFFGADLTGADFSFAILSHANLDFANWKQVVLDANTLIDNKPKLIWQLSNQGAPGATLTNLDLAFANLSDANFNGTKFNGSDCSATDFRLSDLRNANFTNANMRFVDFRGTLLNTNTVLEAKSRLVWSILNQDTGAGADLHGTNLSSTLLLEADLSGANLTNLVFTTGICEGSKFGGSNLSRANCTQTDFFACIFTNANLTQAVFRFTDLTQANFRNALTNGTDFTGATFSNTIMPDGSIRNF